MEPRTSTNRVTYLVAGAKLELATVVEFDLGNTTGSRPPDNLRTDIDECRLRDSGLGGQERRTRRPVDDIS